MEEEILKNLQDVENNPNYNEMVRLAGSICDMMFKSRKTKIFTPDNPDTPPDEIHHLLKIFREKMNESNIPSDLDDYSLYNIIQKFYRHIIIKHA